MRSAADVEGVKAARGEVAMQLVEFKSGAGDNVHTVWINPSHVGVLLALSDDPGHTVIRMACGDIDVTVNEGIASVAQKLNAALKHRSSDLKCRAFSASPEIFEQYCPFLS
jgi:hypothetical protein